MCFSYTFYVYCFKRSLSQARTEHTLVGSGRLRWYEAKPALMFARSGCFLKRSVMYTFLGFSGAPVGVNLFHRISGLNWFVVTYWFPCTPKRLLYCICLQLYIFFSPLRRFLCHPIGICASLPHHRSFRKIYIYIFFGNFFVIFLVPSTVPTKVVTLFGTRT